MFKKDHFERILHHEVFHLINESFKKLFSDDDWKDINSKKFSYAECSTCSNRLNLSLLAKTDGFLTEYSMSTASEDMGEVFSFLVTDREKIENKSLKDRNNEIQEEFNELQEEFLSSQRVNYKYNYKKLLEDYSDLEEEYLNSQRVKYKIKYMII